MRTYITVFIFSFFSLYMGSLYSQNDSEREDIRGVSGQTAIFILKIQANNAQEYLNSPDFQKEYGMIQLAGDWYIHAFVITDNLSSLDKYGFLPQGKNTDRKILSGMLPVTQLTALSVDPDVRYVEMSHLVDLQLEEARSQTKTDSVHSGIGLPQIYGGENVVVGIVDQGFDYTHPTFYDTSGANYRISRVWEQSASSGTPPSGYSYGRELVGEATILAAQRDLTNSSHGTHVAGIAAGSGRGTDGLFTGMAPKSEIVMVATSLQLSPVLDGIEYIMEYAKSVNKACVVNLSLAGNLGPRDGNSAFDQSCEQLVSPGNLLVGAAGNDGNRRLYLGKSFSATDTVLYTFVQYTGSLSSSGTTYIDIWGEVGDNYEFRFSIYNTDGDSVEDQSPLLSASTSSAQLYTLLDSDGEECKINLGRGVSPLNGKANVFAQIDHRDQTDAFQQVRIEIFAKNTKVNMWAVQNNATFTNSGYSSPVEAGQMNSTVSEVGGTGKRIISVGSYNSMMSYENLSGDTRSSSAALGQISGFSSRGPTADNRTKPDITAPGMYILSSFNRFHNSNNASGNSTVLEFTDSGTNWYYGASQGTSMAAPVVTGIIALWLEEYPELTYEQAMERLKASAIADGFTGVIPDSGHNRWGWGKVNAYNGLLDLIAEIPAQPAINPDGEVFFCDGDSAVLNGPTGFPAYEWSSGDTTANLSVFTAGDYALRIANAGGYKSPWSDSTRVHVYPNPPAPAISQLGDSSLTTNVGSGIQWYKDVQIRAGDTAQILIHDFEGGYYHLVYTDENGCSSSSDTVYVSGLRTSDSFIQENKLQVYPNPSSGIFYLNSTYKTALHIQLMDMTGSIVFQENLPALAQKQLDLDKLPSGLYFLRLSAPGVEDVVKLLLQ